MKKVIYILILITTLDAHTKMMLKRYYTYYLLGYKYSKTILNDVKSKQIALSNSKQMCIDTLGSAYMDSKFKGSCIFGVTNAMSGKAKIDLKTFLTSYIHEKF